MVFINFEILGVEFVEAIFGSKPHEAQTILRNGQYTALRQSVFYGQVIETNLFVLRKRSYKGKH